MKYMIYIVLQIKKIVACLIVFFWISSDYLVAQSDTMMDPRDGKLYRTITIGSQTWMAENLAYAYPIPIMKDAAYSFDPCNSVYCYNDDSANCKKFGMLYDWGPAQKACPAGWHLPSLSEFSTLLTFVEGASVSKKARKKQSYSVLTSDSGFAALHAGFNSLSFKGYHFIGRIGLFWSSTEKSKYDAQSIFVSKRHSNVYISPVHKSDGLSIRCIKD